MDQTSKQITSTPRSFAVLITLVATLMVLFGLAEVVTSFTHQFFGLSTSRTIISTVLGVILGLFYVAGGLLLFLRKAWAARAALVLLCGDILGRIALVITGLYPINSFRQGFGIVAGTVIAAIFALYILLNYKSFQRS